MAPKTDKVENSRTFSAAQETPDFHVAALLSEGRPAQRSAAAPETGSVLLDNPYTQVAQRQLGAHQQRVEPYDRNARFTNFTPLHSDKPYLRDHPTVLILDHFSGEEGGTVLNRNPSNPGTVITHGEMSATPAEAKGYNVLRFETKFTPLDRQLTEIANALDSGKLRLGKGDALNVSMVETHLMKNFQDTSRLLGMNITPANLQQSYGAMMQAMERRVNDPSLSAPDRAILREALDTNKAIERIQAHGVTVVHAAGNTGRNTLALDFIKADHQLAATDEAGQPFSWSSRGNELQRGRWEVTYRPNSGFTPGDRAPVENGTYLAAGTPFKKNPNDKWMTFDGTHSPLASNPEPLTGSKVTSWDPQLFSPQIDPIFTKGILVTRTDAATGALTTTNARGTSFADIGFFQQNYQRLYELKNHR